MSMFEKGRRPWKRGAKKRYSVYKAEDRQDGEEDYKKWAEMTAEAHGYNIDEFKPEAMCRNFWQETYDRIHGHWCETKYIKEKDALDAFMKDLQAMVTLKDGGELQINGDTKALYEKHPTIRVGIRRALVVVKKKLMENDTSSKKVRKS
jgi:hypothetical protein